MRREAGEVARRDPFAWRSLLPASGLIPPRPAPERRRAGDGARLAAATQEEPPPLRGRRDALSERSAAQQHPKVSPLPCPGCLLAAGLRNGDSRCRRDGPAERRALAGCRARRIARGGRSLLLLLPPAPACPLRL